MKAMEAHAPIPLEDGARLAWALYAAGRFDESRHWLELSVQNDPLALWLRAKFDLRAGNLTAANSHLAEAIHILSSGDNWSPGNPYLESIWSEAPRDYQEAAQGRLLAEAGIVALSQKEYTAALEGLRTGGFASDAAYVAEHLLSTDELLRHVRKVAPQYSNRPAGEEPDEEDQAAAAAGEVDPGACLDPDVVGVYEWSHNADNRLRYQLARRLAREGRLEEAGEFMPPSLHALFRHYTALALARKSGRYSGEALAAITWRQAHIHRLWGAELFSTDSAPDGGLYEWSFPADDFSKRRGFREGWTTRWLPELTSEEMENGDDDEFSRVGPAELEDERAIPAITLDEAARAKVPQVAHANRFHYRYVAADIAWEAAALLPDNHPQLAGLYNTAGQWLAARDPKAADRFYQAMVKRCKETPEGPLADKKRWFLDELPALGDLAALPAELKPARKVPTE